jgi:hypothetical protein
VVTLEITGMAANATRIPAQEPAHQETTATSRMKTNLMKGLSSGLRSRVAAMTAGIARDANEMRYGKRGRRGLSKRRKAPNPVPVVARGSSIMSTGVPVRIDLYYLNFKLL